jgi:enterochelin esterase-like enzyme
MQDGEKVFREDGEGVGGWGVPETVRRLSVNGRITPPIVVAIAATENRAGEYMPGKPLEMAGAAARAEEFFRAHRERVYVPRSQEYLRFLTEELLPRIESEHVPRLRKRRIVAMGSSRGALISIYALAEYPALFSGAACLSTHWPHGDGIVIDWLAENLPPPGRHLFYFDHGDQGLDAAYPPYQERMDTIMRERGYRRGEDWKSEYFPGDGHNEGFWRARLHVPLEFLFPAQKESA